MATIDNLLAGIEAAKAKAHIAARRLLAPAGFAIPTSEVVDRARLAVIEMTLAGLMAERSSYIGTFDEVKALELRDYWEAVAEEVAK